MQTRDFLSMTPIHKDAEEAGMMMALLERAIKSEMIKVIEKLNVTNNDIERQELNLELKIYAKMIPLFTKDFYIKSY